MIEIPQSIYILSKNPGKLKEINDILRPFSFSMRSIYQDYSPGDVPETGSSYAENALLKARRGFEVSGKFCVGEDSGLEIDALDGAPGLYSARFGGELFSTQDKNERILELLKDIPPKQRSARFVCVAALAWEGGERLFEGHCEGWIAQETRGQSGFGYDPIFILPPYDQTFAELGEKIKNRFSHRALAFRKLVEFLLSKPDNS